MAQAIAPTKSCKLIYIVKLFELILYLHAQVEKYENF